MPLRALGPAPVAPAAWALAMGRGSAIGAARARVEPFGDHGCAVRARPVCVSVGGVSGRIESVQRPLFMRLWAATRASPRAQVRCVLGFHAVQAYPGRGWPREGLAKHQESVTAIVSSQCSLLGSMRTILMVICHARVWLCVRLTPYPLSYDPMGSIGWVWHGGIGPLNFACGGRTVTEVFLH